MWRERCCEGGPEGSGARRVPRRWAKGRKVRVVVVDDEPAMAGVLAEYLSGHFEVAAFTDPGEALRFIRANHVELLVTDWHMPSLDGMRLATEAKRLRPGLKILMVTGTPGALGCGGQEVDMLLTKPVRPQRLKASCYKLVSDPAVTG